LECGDLSPLWPAARSLPRMEPILTNAGQSGDKAPHSKELKTAFDGSDLSLNAELAFKLAHTMSRNAQRSRFWEPHDPLQT